MTGRRAYEPGDFVIDIHTGRMGRVLARAPNGLVTFQPRPCAPGTAAWHLPERDLRLVEGEMMSEERAAWLAKELER